MADSGFRVFSSAVTSEFGRARDALANDLQSHDVIVRVQRSFRYDGEAETLLHKLRNYIERCDVVPCLIGARSGAFPTVAEAAPFRDDLPDGITEASYTQWEFFFARHFGRLCLVYLASDKFQRDERKASLGERSDFQAAFVAQVKALGLQRTAVGNLHEFRADALKDLLRSPAQHQMPATLRESLTNKLASEFKPIVLPYPSLGSSVQGP